MLAERGLESKPREHDDLRDHRKTVAYCDVRHRFDQRHGAGLCHASNPKRLSA